MERRNWVLLGVVLGGVLGGSATAFGQVPESLPYIGNMSSQRLQIVLEGIGFTDLTDMVRAGRIHYAKATWECEQVDLRINTKSGAITDESAVVEDATHGRPGSLAVPIARSTGATEAQVASALEGVGYTDVSVTKREGRIFNASATWDGNAYDLRINFGTGQIRDTAFIPPSNLGSQGMPSSITSIGGRHDVASVAQNLEAVGYKNVSVVRREGRIYRATAVWDNDIVELRINAETGLLTQR